MSYQKLNLGKILMDDNKLSLDDLEQALTIQLKTGKDIREILISEGLLAEEEILASVAAHLNIPFLDSLKFEPDRKALQVVPEALARQYSIFPLYKIWDTLHIAVADSLDIFAIDNLRIAVNSEIKQVLTQRKSLLECINNYYSKLQTLPEILQSDVTSAAGSAKDSAVADSQTLIQESQAEPIVEAVNRIIEEAISKRASDIHIEPSAEDLTIRYRIDGILRTVYALPKRTQRGVAARLKIISDLDITKFYLPQDGRFHLMVQGKEIDFRVSSLPTLFGEKFVLRILDKTGAIVSLTELGFSEHSLKLVKAAMAKDHGMILMTGPTGSGKSTTLYSILNEMNTLERHIVTIEDPVEYQLNGISQAQIKAEIDFTFAAALRGILRQSPDIIMVGEIRDSETADIAIKASLIGQLILSTLHTNDAVSAFARLIDMGIERYLVASALILVCAQRLCRKICPHCKEPLESVPEPILHDLGIDLDPGVQFYHGRGCGSCFNTGYKGRVALLEALQVEDYIREMIIREDPFEQIKAKAIRDGKLITLRSDGISKIKAGITTIEEVYRVTSKE
jgi:type IV pilus assembly protein PilB